MSHTGVGQSSGTAEVTRVCRLTSGDLDLHGVSPAALAPGEAKGNYIKEKKLAVFFLEQSSALGSRSRLLCDLLCRLRRALGIPTMDLSHFPTNICI